MTTTKIELNLRMLKLEREMRELARDVDIFNKSNLWPIANVRAIITEKGEPATSAQSARRI